MASFVTFK